MKLEKYQETVTMKGHLCQVKVFGGYLKGNDQLSKDFKGYWVWHDQICISVEPI